MSKPALARGWQWRSRGSLTSGFPRGLDQSRDFYEHVLGFTPVRCDILKLKEGGHIRQIFFDTGRDQIIASMEARDVPGVPADYDAGINRGLGVPSVFYHCAFGAGSEAALDEKRAELSARGADVTEQERGPRLRLGLTRS